MPKLTDQEAAALGARIKAKHVPARPAPALGAPPLAAADPAADPTVLDTFDTLTGSAIVVDDALARESACIAVEIGSRQLVYSPGVVGALSTEQTALYCETTEMRPLTDKQRARLEAFRSSGDACEARGTGVEGLRCVSEEMRKRGQRL